MDITIPTLILTALAAVKEGGLTPEQIADSIRVTNAIAIDPKLIRIALQQMERESKVSRPEIYCLPQASTAPGERDKVLSFLSTHPNSSTLDVARHVFGAGAVRSSINPLLYALQKQGLVEVKKAEGGKDPRWSAIGAATTTADVTAAVANLSLA